MQREASSSGQYLSSCESPTWISTAPVLSPRGYPIMLDFAEAARRIPGCKLLASAASALAPTWEELDKAGITSASPLDLASIEIPERSEYTVQARYVGGALARGLVQLGTGSGLLFRGPHRFNEDASIFFERALREARIAHTPVAVELPHLLRDQGKFSRRYPDAIRISPATVGNKLVDITHRPTQILAVCPHGAPLSVVAAAAGQHDPRPFWCVEAGFDGRPWAWLSPAKRRRVLTALPLQTRQQAHARLFRAWPATGWDYLRRAVHAWESGDASLIAEQAVSVAYALRNLGPEFALRHLRSVADCSARIGLPASARSQLWAGTAGLFREAGSGAPSAAALPFTQRALKAASAPSDVVERLYDVANHYARSRTPAALSCARGYYAKAFRLLPSIADEEDRIRKEVRLLNGLALVAYHERNHSEALDLEQRAHALIDATLDRFPSLAAWAKPLLNTNTAKLLVQRFSDGTAAARYLRDSAASDDTRVRRKATIDLARLAFDSGETVRVVELLSEIYGKTFADENEVEEVVGRAIYSIACLTIGRADEAADSIARVKYLSQALGLSGGLDVVAAVEAQIAASRKSALGAQRPRSA